MLSSRTGTLAFLDSLKKSNRKRQTHKQQVLGHLQELVSQRRFASLPKIINVPLADRLTVLRDIRQSYSGNPCGELFIHWFYPAHNGDDLSRCEIFHLNMLAYFNVVDRVEVIHVRCASSLSVMTPQMRKAVEILSSGKASVDFKIVSQKLSWEHDTFKEAAEYAVETGKFVYYTHFKGITRISDPVLGITASRTMHRTSETDIYYWSYLMYSCLFDAPENVMAIGPICHSGKNQSYSRKNISWSSMPLGSSAYHYCGSFQAFSGEYIRYRFNSCGLNTREIRDNKLWVRDPYTVEMFLSLVSLKKDVYSLNPNNILSASAYRLYQIGAFPEYKEKFDCIYLNVCIANGTYKYIGGTDTFNYALGTTLQKMGFTVYYFAPDMDGNGVTEHHLMRVGIHPYKDEPLYLCFANQASGKYFIDKCPVIQTLHSAFTDLELPVDGMSAYVAISEEVQEHVKKLGYDVPLVRNGIDLDRFRPRRELRKENPVVLAICQGDDSLLRDACGVLGYEFRNVPKAVGERIWDIDKLIDDADIVVGIGRSLYDAMACGKVCISWDNRKLNPYSGCGYVTASNWQDYAKTNFTGRGFPRMDTVEKLVAELSKYNPADGKDMRRMAEAELDMARNIRKYLGFLDNGSFK